MNRKSLFLWFKIFDRQRCLEMTYESNRMVAELGF